MNEDFERIWKELVLSWHMLVGPRKKYKNLSQDTSVPAKIQSEHLSYRTLECYEYNNLPGNHISFVTPSYLQSLLVQLANCVKNVYNRL
jgi:hypothetical protein